MRLVDFQHVQFEMETAVVTSDASERWLLMERDSCLNQLEPYRAEVNKALKNAELRAEFSFKNLYRCKKLLEKEAFQLLARLIILQKKIIGLSFSRDRKIVYHELEQIT